MPQFILDTPLRNALDEIRAEADRRQATTPSDATIEAFNFAAATLALALDEASKQSERLTAEQYAALHNCSPQIVRRWCQRGELAAERTANGWLIAHDAKRKERERKVG